MVPNFGSYFFGLLLLLLSSGPVVGFEATELKPCELQVLRTCLDKFVRDFRNHPPNLPTLQVHCRADFNLAKCTAASRCNGQAVGALSKAILSYLVFDGNLLVCPKHSKEYWKLMIKVAKGNGCGFGEILRILKSRKSRCAKRADVNCLRSYVHMMKKNPNLCVNIPKKYQCLRAATKTCRAGILESLLDVFPREANKVLHVLCQK